MISNFLFIEVNEKNGDIVLQYLKMHKNLIKLPIQSCHKQKKEYEVSVEYKPNSIGYSGISRYTSE